MRSLRSNRNTYRFYSLSAVAMLATLASGVVLGVALPAAAGNVLFTMSSNTCSAGAPGPECGDAKAQVGGSGLNTPTLMTMAPAKKAIAAALSDADALIESLEQLITKKRQIKQGAMQELLSGKRRLPDFMGEWEHRTIESLEKANLVRLSRGNVISRKDIERSPGDYPIYSSSAKKNGKMGSADSCWVKNGSVITVATNVNPQAAYSRMQVKKARSSPALKTVTSGATQMSTEFAFRFQETASHSS